MCALKEIGICVITILVQNALRRVACQSPRDLGRSEFTVQQDNCAPVEEVVMGSRFGRLNGCWKLLCVAVWYIVIHLVVSWRCSERTIQDLKPRDH